jgi:signal transduction histidine kinase
VNTIAPRGDQALLVWTKRNKLALTFFGLVAFAFAAMLVAFWLSYWNSFAFYLDRVKTLVAEDTRQFKARIDQDVATGCEILKVNNSTYVTSAEIRNESGAVCPLSPRASDNSGKCANPSWLQPVLYLHCRRVLHMPKELRPDDIEITATESDLRSSVRLGNGNDLIMNRSHAETLGTWRTYAEAQGRAFALPLSAIAIIVLAFWYIILRRVTALAREARRAVKSREMDIAWPEKETYDELSTLAYFRELLHQTAVQAETLRRQNSELVRQNDSLRRVRKMIGHEIYSPLQILQSISETNPRALSQVSRIRRATDAILNESASPTTLKEADLAAFLRQWVANTLVERDLARLVYVGPNEEYKAKVDMEQLEDCLDHLVNNATDFRFDDTDIVVELSRADSVFNVVIENRGPLIPDEALERIFDYGVSLRATPSDSNLGQGLHHARLYAIGMGGSLVARNLPPDRVLFTLSIPAATLGSGASPS